MMLLEYASKKELKASVGESLRYTETSLFGPQYISNGVIYGAHRPHLQGGREWFAKVIMENDKIKKVS